MGVWMLVFDIGGLAGGNVAGATWTTPGGLVGWVGRVEPKHISIMVVPDGHDEDHTILQRLTHLFEATLVLEVILVREGVLGALAHFIGDRVELLVHGIDLG